MNSFPDFVNSKNIMKKATEQKMEDDRDFTSTLYTSSSSGSFNAVLVNWFFFYLL